MNKRFLKLSASTIALATSAAVGPLGTALAQPSQQFAMEEIVVTARKRQESLMEVPISISAVTSADIEKANIKDLSTLAMYTPGLWIEYSVSSAAGRATTFRGLSESSGQIFIDGAPYAGPGTPNLGDLERVEVLVGPQSAYFGRSTFEGALNFVTKNPGDSFRGKVSSQYASYDTSEMGGEIEGPIIPGKLNGRISARHYKAGGHWQNFANASEMLGEESFDNISASLYYTPTDDLSVKLLLSHDQTDNGANASMALTAFGYNGVFFDPRNQRKPYTSQELKCNLGGTFGPYWCGALPSGKEIDPTIISANNVLTPYLYDVLIKNLKSGQPTPFNPKFKDSTGFKALSKVAHLYIDYDFADGWNFSSITAIHETRNQNTAGPNYRDDQIIPNPSWPTAASVWEYLIRGAVTTNIPGVGITEVLPYIGFHLTSGTIVYDRSQELRLSSPQDAKLRGTLGFNYSHVKSPGGFNYGKQPRAASFSGTTTRTYTSTPAVFGGIYYDLDADADLTVSAEARYQWDRVSARPIWPVFGAELKALFTSFSPRVTVDYKISDDTLLYGLWSRGYKPGGFNSTVVGQPASVLAQLAAANAGITFEEEKLDNFEMGIKPTLFDGRLQVRADVYYQTWRNGQVSNSQSITTAAGVGQMITITSNVGAVDLYGVEVQANWAPTENITVNATFGYQTSNIKSGGYLSTPLGLRVRGTTNVNGNRFPNAPDFAWTLSPSYNNNLVGDWDWFARADWRHRGKYMIDATNVAWLAPRDTFNFRMGINTTTTTLELFVENLTNDQGFVNGVQGNDATSTNLNSNTNEIRLILPKKRQFGVKAVFNF